MVDAGHIPARCLFTIRRGELARDNVRGTLAPLAKEIIKIKGHPGRWTCLFYDQASRGCGIYDYRPLECRALNCRDTRRIKGVYQTTRLTRQDLLSGVNGLWELIEDHEQRCSYEALHVLVREGTHKGRLKMEEKILEILRFDAHVRQLTVEKGKVDNRMLEFIFGRPLAETITMFEIKLVRTDRTYALAPTPAFSRKHQVI